MTSVLDLVDGGNQRGDGRAGINPSFCGRQGCKEPPCAGFSFCRDCLAWLRCETDDDPLGEDDPNPYLEILRGGGET